jgi:Glycosyltransferase family 10 (fucosyltransferase) C-term
VQHLKVGLLSRHLGVPWLRQTVNGDGQVGGVQLLLSAADDVDALVVFDEPFKGQATKVPIERRILITGEPSNIKRYTAAYLNQFGTVISPYRHWGYRGRLLRQQAGLPWFYGLVFENGGLRVALDFRELEQLVPKPRRLAVSAVISAKKQTPMHRRRLAFVELLRERIGDQLLLFGNGFKPVPDKADAIDACRYHLVLENSADDHYWSEKLADAYLGWALPIFSGTPSIGQYFPAGSYETIDTGDPVSAVETVVRVLDQDPWQSRLPQLQEARRKLLYEYNYTIVVANAVKDMPGVSAMLERPQIILGNSAATIGGRLQRALRLK